MSCWDVMKAFMRISLSWCGSMGGNLERFVKCKYNSFTVGLIKASEEDTGSKVTSKPVAWEAKRSAIEMGSEKRDE